MNIPSAIAFILLTTFCFGQPDQVDKVVVNVTAAYKPVNVELLKGGNQISFIQAPGGKIRFKGLEAGYYTIRISGLGQATTNTDSILVKKGQLLELSVKQDGPCLYDHPANKIPTCPENHTDDIIPIAYGLIGHLTGSSESEYYQGDCVVSDCDPKYYCKKHQVKF